MHVFLFMYKLKSPNIILFVVIFGTIMLLKSEMKVCILYECIYIYIYIYIYISISLREMYSLFNMNFIIYKYISNK